MANTKDLVMNPRATLLILIAFFLAAITACESPDEAQPEAPQSTEAAPEETPDIPTEEEVAAEQDAIDSVAETEGLEEEEAATDEIELSVPAFPAAATSANWKYSEGEHYRSMTASQGTSSPPDKIEVAEVFWYGCPHCYNFDPIIESWKQSLPPDVSFVRIPVIWNPTNQVHARIMYTAEALDKLDEAHAAMFDGIHQKFATYTTDESIVELFEQIGVGEEEFREVYSSFGVTSAVKRAENLTRRYGIRSVPIIVVNGKYVTEGPGIKSFEDILGVTGELVERERARL
ncbi:MAG: thiol:disulfide interchange protein DsbA/DsbL [Gammaproteobacteria bacterium]|jgi:thiol:disulfide interchange protein DsbA|nr:thiol:disulfide interchange protein DsbA/DsbL [Gammaproteobacteria bacterium]MDP6617610.1 thiol:disulfide interchange protein DsbA/DsbL [Gammaproteobacteria bacterium]MDP6694487.1 thiol:disulfide interchange protein DsbA/DsbL [Gammaproteobacteria bacterium]